MAHVRVGSLRDVVRSQIWAEHVVALSELAFSVPTACGSNRVEIGPWPRHSPVSAIQPASALQEAHANTVVDGEGGLSKGEPDDRAHAVVGSVAVQHQAAMGVPVTSLATIMFVLTYTGMALGRVPGLKIDRTGIALIAAVILVATGEIPANQIPNAIHFPTLLLMGGLMILSARVRAAGFYEAAAAWIARQAGQPLRLLALTIGIGGTLSAVLVNDIVVFAMTPLLCTGLAARKLDPRPFLFGLAAASNVGSAATLIGNPQNILIGQVGRLGFWSYFAIAFVPAMVGLGLVFACVAMAWRSALAAEASDAAIGAPTFDRRQTTVCGVALAVLLVLFTTSLPREISALLIAACLIISRTVPSRQLLDEIDLPLLILFASLFVVNDAFARTGLAGEALQSLISHGLLPDRVSLLAPLSLLLSNTIGNVPAVVMLLQVWGDVPEGTLVGLAILSTLSGNLLLVGSLANLIVAERAALAGLQLSLGDHAKAGVPITLVSLLLAGMWIWAMGLMRL
jgi:Na+/H+ antiporter NhaD/arsenite permease-like protein